MEVKITKLTDLNLLHKCAEFTTGHESKMSLAKAYASGHSIVRSQIFFVECRDIPLFVASQLVRTHVGVQFFQRSKRTDRGGEDFPELCQELSDMVRWLVYDCQPLPYAVSPTQIERKCRALIDNLDSLPQRFDRLAPTDLCFIINAEALINMAHKRLCHKASAETFAVMESLRAHIKNIDPDLAKHLVPMCVYRGGICPEPNSCHAIAGKSGQEELAQYCSLFVDQRKANER